MNASATAPAHQIRTRPGGCEKSARALVGSGPLAVLLLVVAANWLLWASAVPFGDAPDEPSHLDVAQFLAAYGRLPIFGPDADVYVRLDQVGIPIEPHALSPPLTYVVDAALIRLLPVAPPVAARLGSLLAALAAVALTYAFVRTLHSTLKPLALPVAALLAAVPQFSFHAAVVNSDIFALATALAVATLWRGVISAPGALVFGLAVGCALLSKYTAYPAAAAGVLAATWHVLTAVHHSIRRPRLRALGLLMLVGLGAMLVAGPWLVHNWMLYGGPWPLGVVEPAMQALAPALETARDTASRSFWDREYLQSWGVITFRSFWAGFDRVSLFAPAWVYVALAAALVVAMLGLGRGLRVKHRRADARAILQSPTGVLLVVWTVGTLLATVALSVGRFYPVHGRYLLVLLPLVALALVVGWQGALPRRWAHVTRWALVAAMGGLNAYCLFAVVLPHYFGPSGTRVVVTVDAPLPGAAAHEPVDIRGWAVVTSRPTWQPGLVGGPVASHVPAASVWVTVDGQPAPNLAGAPHVDRPDVARALQAPAAAKAGFAYEWDTRTAPPGVHVVEVCAADPAAAEATCVPLPVHVDDN